MKRRGRSLRRRYGRAHALTPDVFPYRGYGIMDRGEYAAHLKALRAVRDAEKRNGLGTAEIPGGDADIASDAFMAGMAILRGGLVRQGRDGFFKLTPYGRIYLEQREGGR